MGSTSISETLSGTSRTPPVSSRQPATGPRFSMFGWRRPPLFQPHGRSARSGLGMAQTRFALQLCRHFGLEPAEVANDLRRLIRLLPVNMNPGQLVPAVGAHGLQFGVLPQSDHRFIEAALDRKSTHL